MEARVARLQAGHAALLAAALAGCTAAPPRPPEGRFAGLATLGTDTVAVRVVFESLDDSLVATWSCPEVMVLDQPLEDLRWETPRLRFVASKRESPLVFDGTVRGDTIVGSIRIFGAPGNVAPEAGFVLARDLTRETRPYPTEAVTVRAPETTLSGTLFLPPDSARHPAVVLLHGSSDGLRDAYRSWADRFARAGIVALVFDRRGTGASTGDAIHSDYADLAGDAAAAVRYLASRPEVDTARVGVWGLSQGAMLAPRVVAQEPRVSFVVAVSGPGMPTGEVAAWQDSLRVLARGFTQDEAHETAELHRALYDWIRSPGHDDALEARLRAAAATRWGRYTGLPPEPPASDRLLGWYWGGRLEDPLEWWRRVRVPVLLLYGARDDLVPAEASARRIARALRDGGARDVTTLVYPRANHALKRVPASGEPLAWPRVDPEAVNATIDWIGRRAVSRRAENR